MIDLLNEKANAIKELCQKHFIKELHVFGSAASGKFNDQSDIDFLYKIDLERFKGWDTGKYDYTDNLMSFENSLTDLLLKKIDLVPAGSFIQNKYLKSSIEKTKKMLYAD